MESIPPRWAPRRLTSGVFAWIEAPTDPQPLAWFRAWLGFLCLANLALLWPDMPMWLGNEGVLPPSVHASILEGRRLTLYAFTGYTDHTITLIRGCGFVGGLSLLLGIYPRWGALLSWLALSSFAWRNMYILHSGDNLLRIGSFFLIFAQSARAFSVPAWLRARRAQRTTPLAPPSPELVPAWPLRILQLQLCATYFVTGFVKATGRAWQEGEAVGTVLQLGELQRFPIPDFLMTPLASHVMSYATLAVELGFPFLIWIPRLRVPVLLVGLVFHLGLEWTLNVQLFQWTILGFYLLFLVPRSVRAQRGGGR